MTYLGNWTLTNQRVKIGQIWSVKLLRMTMMTVKTTVDMIETDIETNTEVVMDHLPNIEEVRSRVQVVHLIIRVAKVAPHPITKVVQKTIIKIVMVTRENMQVVVTLANTITNPLKSPDVENYMLILFFIN